MTGSNTREHSSSDANGLASDVSGVVGNEERSDAGDLITGAEAAHRNLREHAIADL